jgi:hypothetical protein
MSKDRPSIGNLGRPTRASRVAASPETAATATVSVRSLLGALVTRLKTDGWAFPLLCGYLIFEYNRPQAIWPVLDVIPWTQVLLIGAIIAAYFDRSARPPAPAAVAVMTGLAVVALMGRLGCDCACNHIDRDNPTAGNGLLFRISLREPQNGTARTSRLGWKGLCVCRLGSQRISRMV